MNKSLKLILTNKTFYLLAGLVLVLILGGRIVSDRRHHGSYITFTAERQDMNVSVIEGGNLVALRSVRIINNVPGNRTVLEAIEDGTSITEEDVEKGLVLLRLDSSDLEDRKDRLQLDVENSWASYMEAEQRLEMQKKQNESDITQAELKIKFAGMDLKRYLGDHLAVGAIESDNLDIPAMLESGKLGGQSLSRMRQLTNNIDIAKEQLTRAEDKAEWSRRLAEGGYITQSELEADKLSVRQREADLERAELEYQLFLDYDFPKEAEKSYSDYRESLLEMERVLANCEARLIQAEASLKSRRTTYELNLSSLREVESQIEQCTIRATHVGFVTTPSPTHRFRTQEPIQPGTVVRRHQELFNVPDFRSMGVEVNIHEASVRKVEAGQRAVVRVDAFPDESFSGVVRRVAHMPDPAMQFLNPDINVYITTVALNNSHAFLRPGMGSQVEIVVSELKDVIAVPIDAVLFRDGVSHCVVMEGSVLTERRVELGESSDTMVEVRSGLREGETVVMQPRMAASQVRKMELEEPGRFEDPLPAEMPSTEILQDPEGSPPAGGRRQGR